MTLTIPFDIETALARPDWREHVGWPIALTGTHARAKQAWQALWPVVHSLGQREQDILLLAGAPIIWRCLALGEAAATIQAANEFNWVVEGGNSTVAFLKSESELDLPPLPEITSPFKTNSGTSVAGLRRLARSLAISSPSAWPRLFVEPDAVAISHNPVMHAFAHAKGFAVQYRHADDIVHGIPRMAISAATNSEWIKSTTELLANTIFGIWDLSPIFRHKVLQLAISSIEQQLATTIHFSSALERLPDFPREIWVGGQTTARYVATEARRRGSKVTRFEHGWGLACEDAADLTAYAEFSGVDRFVAMTPESAKRLKASAAHGLASPRRCIKFLAGPGDVEARKLSLDRKRSNVKSRPTVVYAPTTILGFRQLLPPVMPDPVHLDWQFRLCEELAGFPIRFICRPHPEGFFRKRPHPLNGFTNTKYSTFEDLMNEADVFVFDFQQSTTFGRALCSDRRVVVIDLGTPAFDVETESAIRKRCHVVRARFDERNRPHVDSEELHEAVLGLPDEFVDPSYFRALMLDA